jgi:transposase-like protein
LPKKYRKECISGARKIYLAKNKAEAVRAYKTWESKWRKIKPEAARCIERELDELLAFMDCPEEHRIKVRTTNVIERAFREVRRRVRTMNCFRNQESCERIIYCIFNHLNNHWEQRLLPQFNQFSKTRSDSQ